MSARTPRLGDALVINLGTALLFHSRALALTTRRLSRRVSRFARQFRPRPASSMRAGETSRAPVASARPTPSRALRIASIACVAIACVARGTDARAHRASSISTPSSSSAPASVVDARLRADFDLEDTARAVDVISYEGPAYDGCCPLTASGAGAGDGEMLACCSSGGCCPNTEPGGAYGRHLACCENKGGSESKNRALSRVWYSGPSYDGCCPNADGENLACCGESAGCCPANGERRHSCCPDLGAVREYEDEQEEEGGEEKENEMSYDEDDRRDRTYDSQGLDETRRRDFTPRRRRESGYEERISDEDSVSEEDYSTALYLQIAAGVCVVIWASALVVGAMYQKEDGRSEGGETGPLFDVRVAPHPKRGARRYDSSFE